MTADARDPDGYGFGEEPDLQAPTCVALDLSPRYPAGRHPQYDDPVELASLGPYIGQYTRLLRLHIASDVLAALPDALGTLTQLEELYLRAPALQECPRAILGLRDLRRLDLSTGLADLPDDLFQLVHLQHLGVWRNRLTTLSEAITDLQALRVLNVTDNHLTALPRALASLPRLEELDWMAFSGLPWPMNRTGICPEVV
jgi:hypothetical protein